MDIPHQYIISEIRKLAKKHNWFEADHQRNIYLLSFKRNSTRINIYYSRMTVATAISHPKFGKTQLFRKHVSLEELDKIFINPRVHTEKGYYTK